MDSSGAAGAGVAAGFSLVFLLMLLLGVALYFLPTILALIRHSSNTVAVVLINIFLGWTFVGWIVAIVLVFVDSHNQVNVYVASQPYMNQPTGPPLSPDGQYFWNGTAWMPVSSGASPAQPPPPLTIVP